MAHKLTPVSQGPRTKPRVIPFALGSTISHGPFTYVGLPRTWAPSSAIDGVVHGDGVSRMRHITKGTAYPTGLLAPATPPNVSTQGTHNERSLDFTDAEYRVATGTSSYLQLAASSSYILARVTIAAVLGTKDDLFHVLYDPDHDVMVQRFADMVNGVNEGVTWELPADTSSINAGWGGISAVKEGLVLRLISDDYHRWLNGWALTLEGNRPFIGVTLGAETEPVVPDALRLGRAAYVEFSGTANPSGGDELIVTADTGEYLATINFTSTGLPAKDSKYYVVRASTKQATFRNLCQLLERVVGDGNQWQEPDFTLVGDTLRGWQLYWKSTSAFVLASNRLQADPNLEIVHTQSWTPVSPATVDGGLDPDDSLPDPGSYRYRTGAYRTIDLAQSAGSEISEPVDHDGEPVAVQATDLSPDFDVDRFDVWRTLVGGLGGDMFLVEHAPTNVNPYIDKKTDDEIAGVNSIPYNPREFRGRAGGYPPAWRNLISYDRAVWGCGGSRGAPQVFQADVTEGDDTLTPKAPVVPTQLWLGRTLQGDDEGPTYRVVFVEESTGEVQIDRAWEGPTATDFDITVTDERRAHAIGRSEARKPNQWPIQREWEGIESEHPDGVTACAKARESFFAWTREGIWRLTGSAPGEYVLREVADGVGCAAHRTLVVVDGIAYWLEGPQGFYAWGFGSVDVQAEAGAPDRISNPRWLNEGDPFGIQDTVDRINIDELEWAFAHVDPDGRVIRWFLPVDGATLPNMVISYDLKTGTWATCPCEGATAAASVLGPGGDWVTLVGDNQGNVWQLDSGDSAGVYDFEPFHTLTGATDDVLTVTGAGFPADLEGAPVLVIHEDGEYEMATIADTDSANVYLQEALVRTPAVGAYIVLGALLWELEPNRFHFGVVDSEKKVSHFWIGFSPRAGAQGHIYVGVEDDALDVPAWDAPEIDFSLESGVERPAVSLTGYEMTYRLFGFMPGNGPVLRRIEANARVRQKPQVQQ